MKCQSCSGSLAERLRQKQTACQERRMTLEADVGTRRSQRHSITLNRYCMYSLYSVYNYISYCISIFVGIL